MERDGNIDGGQMAIGNRLLQAKTAPAIFQNQRYAKQSTACQRIEFQARTGRGRKCIVDCRKCCPS